MQTPQPLRAARRQAVESGGTPPFPVLTGQVSSLLRTNRTRHVPRQVVESGGTVYVHCKAGRGRAASSVRAGPTPAFD